MPVPLRTKHEIEIKLPVADIRTTIRQLRSLGATAHGRVLERNTLFDTPASDFRHRGWLLRVRQETPAPGHSLRGGPRRAILTFKAPPAAQPRPPSQRRYKDRLERELFIRSPFDWPTGLWSLGLKPGFRYEKYRSSYRLPSLHLDLDETPIGDFLELEGRPQSIARIARALGFSPSDYIRDTYWDLYAADCLRRGRVVRNMLFRR